MLTGPQGWITFFVVLTGLLALDLGLFHRRAHRVQLREALGWSALWIVLGLAFGLAVYFLRGATAGIEYFTGYIVEKSLSVDNLFVIAVIFKYFRVDPRYQHRVLFWGILGALVMRALVIFAGVSVLEHFAFAEYLFAAFLIYTGIKMLRDEEDEDDFCPDRNVFVRIARRMLPVTDGYHADHFFIRLPCRTPRNGSSGESGASESALAPRNGRPWSLRLHATPLLIVLLVVETADLLFAVDSIPAVLLITRDPFVVLTSNVFAILGLRALFFVLAGVIDRFHYLKIAVCVILVFVGGKMLLAHTPLQISTPVSLAVIIAVLTTAAVFSVWRERRARPPSPDAEALSEHTAATEAAAEEQYVGP